MVIQTGMKFQMFMYASVYIHIAHVFVCGPLYLIYKLKEIKKNENSSSFTIFIKKKNE